MMSLEECMEANTLALTELTKAVLLGKTGGKAAPAPATPAAAAAPAVAVSATKPAPKAAKRTTEEVMAIAVRVKNEISKEAAQFLIAKTGAASLKLMKSGSYDAFIADCEMALESGEVEGMDGSGDEDGL